MNSNRDMFARPKRVATFLLQFAIVVAPSAARGAWITYQGDDSHDGYVSYSPNPAKFAPLWQANLGGTLNSVAAANGEVFVSQSTYFGTASLFALNSANGHTLWSTPFNDVYSVNPPAYANGTVYIQTGQGTSSPPPYLTALNAQTGTLDFQSTFAAQFESYLAPTPYAGNIYVDGGYYGGMYSFNGTNGGQNWFGTVGQYDGWTPAVDANYAYVYTGSGSITPITGQFRMINRTTGATQYLITDPNFQWDGYTMNSAVVLGPNSDAFAINEPGTVYPNYGADGRLIMFDLRADATHTPHIGWVLTDNYTGEPTLANGVLYVDDGGTLDALSESTGAFLWAWAPPGNGSITGNIIATNTDLFVETASDIFAVDLHTHQTVWETAGTGSLALSDEILYASDGGELLAFSVVPEPSSLILFGIGGLALGGWGARRRIERKRIRNSAAASFESSVT